MWKPNPAKYKKYVIHLGLVIFLTSFGYIGYFYYKTQRELKDYKTSADVQAFKERDELLKTLNELVILPTDEEPTIATVTDAFRLRGQKFFSNAENGDKVVVYAKAQRAILYRPSQNKIVESAPVNIQDFADGPQQLAGTKESTSSNYVLGEKEQRNEKPAKIAVYNGTLFVTGLATKLSNYLKQQYTDNQLEVVLVENAEDSYDKTILIDVTEKQTKLAKDIASKINGELIDKPDNVNYPDVDIIVIAGKNIKTELFDQ